MNNFNLMILAAGYGRRMKDLTISNPKPLLKINDKELLKHNIDFFINLGCEKIVINTHYLHEKINNFIKNYYYNKNIKLIYEPILLNTGGGIKNALRFFDNKNFLVSNVDILWKEDNKNDILKFIDKYQEIKSCMLLLANNQNFLGLKKNKGDFKIENNKLKRWVQNDQHLYYTGLQIINPNIFSLIQDKSFSINILWDLLINKKMLEGKLASSKVIHIGDVNSFNQFNYN